MRLSSPSAFVAACALFYSVSAAASDDKSPKPLEPCTASSPLGSFYDLRPLSLTLPDESSSPKSIKDARNESWHARGWDYPANFTLNVCAPVVEELNGVVGIDKNLYQNVSAFYDLNGTTYSLGQQSSNITIRGRRIVLEYLNGSPCDTASGKRSSSARRKSATISFHCETDPLATTAIASYVGTDSEQCAYFFEIRSHAACVGSPPAEQGAGPGAVFAIIGLIAIMVYFLGGVFYQRNVAHARGWRQLPNYSMWAGIGGFLKDLFIIATSSCSRLFPQRRGYSILSTSAIAGSGSRGRGRTPDDENRLIDQLDEEWDD